MKKIIFLFCLCLNFSAFSKELRTLSILAQSKPIQYQVEIAQTPLAKKKGLMFRQELIKNQGMLFVFEKQDIIHMWMKNTFIPLDMLFINKENEIVRIYENALPLNEKIISSIFPSEKVLEINAGEVQRNQIKLGMKIQLE